MVAVPCQHPHAAVHKLLRPGGILRDQVIMGEADNAVAFDIRLVDHIQPIFVAKVEQALIRRVMAGPYAVHIAALHDQHILEHRIHRGEGAQAHVGIVAVDAFEFDWPAVNAEHAPQNIHPAEADAHQFCLGGSRNHKIIQPGGFSRPGIHIGEGAARGGLAIQGRHNSIKHQGTAVIQLHLYLGHASGLHAQAQKPGAHIAVQARVRLHIQDRLIGKAQQHDIPEDAAQAPFVLVLQIGTV